MYFIRDNGKCKAQQLLIRFKYLRVPSTSTLPIYIRRGESPLLFSKIVATFNYGNRYKISERSIRTTVRVAQWNNNLSPTSGWKRTSTWRAPADRRQCSSPCSCPLPPASCTSSILILWPVLRSRSRIIFFSFEADPDPAQLGEKKVGAY